MKEGEMTGPEFCSVLPPLLVFFFFLVTEEKRKDEEQERSEEEEGHRIASYGMAWHLNTIGETVNIHP